MAAGPADAFSSTPRGFSCYDRELITAAADNLWSSSVVAATASTGASWVDDVVDNVGPSPSQSTISSTNSSNVGSAGGGGGGVASSSGHASISNKSSTGSTGSSSHSHGHSSHSHHGSPSSPTTTSTISDSLEKRVLELRRKFHRGRQLQIKHLPREVTEEEIRELLSEWDVQSVCIQAGSARVALCSPELLEDWDRNATYTLRGQRITIVPSPTEMLLCVGRLPTSYTEQRFTALVSTYGEIRRCFLMISERTGDTKGYGFVEYITKESALQAKNALDGRQLLDFTLVCDWLDSSHVSLRSLHSKCLYVDQLPPNYRNMGEFRRIFSGVVNPPYCQIALRNGCPQDWGLVEFLDEDDAEKTQQRLDGYMVHGQRIRVAYYIPGVRAINLYLKLLNDGGSNKGKSALLPDPPAPAVFQQLQSLAKQNPVFAQNLQSIILQQIQDVQKGKGLGNNGVEAQGGKRHPFQKGSGSSSSSSQYSTSPNSSNTLKNAQQTALTILLASQQMQQQQQQQNGVGGLNGVGGGLLNGGGNGGFSPNSGHNSAAAAAAAVALQNQQLLSALQAVSKGDSLNGIPMNNGPNNLSSILGLSPPSSSSSSSSSNLLGLSNCNGMNGGNNGSGGLLGLSSLNTLDACGNGGSNSGNHSNIPQQHNFFQSPPPGLHPGNHLQSLQQRAANGMHNSSNIGLGKDERWSNGNVFSKPSRNSTPPYNQSPNGFHKGALLPSPSGLSSPGLDIPMDTSLNISTKPSANDPLQAVWYSLFGHTSSPSETPNSPSGNTSPLFMKQASMSSNSSIGSPIGRSASESMFGLSHHQQQQQHHQQNNSPPGFATPNNGQFHHHQQSQHSNLSRGGSTGDLQEALNSLLSNPQNLSNLFGGGANQQQHFGGGANGGMSSHGFAIQSQNNPFQLDDSNLHHNLGQPPRGSNPFGDPQMQGGVSTAILDLLMQSMKNDQQQQQQQQHGYNSHAASLQDGFMKERNSWSSGMSTPPSPIGNPNSVRHFNNGIGSNSHHNSMHQMLPQRSGSNGSSEMSGSSPRSPTYSPFSRSHNNNNTIKNNLLESGNGNVSPTPTPWSNSVLGSPPHSILGYGASNNVTHNGFNTGRNIWAPSVSPGNGTNSHSHSSHSQHQHHAQLQHKNSNHHVHGGGGGSGGSDPHHSHHHQHQHQHHHNNLMAQKRKVHNEPMADAEFASSSPSSTTSSNHLSPGGGNMSCGSTGSVASGNGPLPSNYYNDTYYKKKKKT